MTQTLTDIVCADFHAERASGSTVQEAIGLLAHRHDRSEQHIRGMLTRKGALDGGGRNIALGLKAVSAAAAVAFGFWIAGSKSRPIETALALNDYKRACTGGNRFDTTCKGKFIVWNGTVASIGDDYVRARLNDDLTVDLQDIDPEAQTLVEGQQVRISGWLSRENFVYPDVSDGEIETLETADQATARNGREEAQAAAQREKEQAFDNIMRDYKSGRLGAMNATLTDCQPYASNQQAYGDCLVRSRRAQGW